MCPKRVNYNLEKSTNYTQQFVNSSNVQYEFLNNKSNLDKEKKKLYLDSILSEVIFF